MPFDKLKRSELEINMAYQLPRSVKGEGRILYIFSVKGLIYTAVGAGVGLLFFLIFRTLGLTVLGIIFTLLFAFLGFSVATFKIPNTNAFEFTRKTGGENIDDVIKRWFIFKFKKKNKIYLYTEGGTKDVR